MFKVMRNGREVARYPSKPECATYILMQGWFEPVERYGVVWARGVEILPA